MFKTVNALVLREVKYKEADRILTIMTDTDGKMTVKAKGALRKSSRISAATEQLKYSEMLLFGNKGRWSVNEALIKEGFESFKTDIDDYALACYFSECVEAISVEEQEDYPLLQLALNSLYALSRKMYTPFHVKAAFEMRLMCLAGYTPELSRCFVCGKTEPEHPLLSIDKGVLTCAECVPYNPSALRLNKNGLEALRHICKAPPKHIMSFASDNETASKLSVATESYLLMHMERSFPTLEYWKKIKNSMV